MLKEYEPWKGMLSTSHYDKEKADKVINFIGCLKHGKGKWAGKPFLLLDWQEKLVRDVYGTVTEEGYRQVRSVYCSVGKKCGKTELIAALCLYALCGDGEASAEVYYAAADRKQASICFNAALSMVRQDPALMKRMKIHESQKRMVYLPTLKESSQAKRRIADVKRIIAETIIDMVNGRSMEVFIGTQEQLLWIAEQLYLQEYLCASKMRIEHIDSALRRDGKFVVVPAESAAAYTDGFPFTAYAKPVSGANDLVFVDCFGFPMSVAHKVLFHRKLTFDYKNKHGRGLFLVLVIDRIEAIDRLFSLFPDSFQFDTILFTTIERLRSQPICNAVFCFSGGKRYHLSEDCSGLVPD